MIGTIRSKQEYALERDEKGKIKPTRVGTKPIQRKDFEYEFDIILAMDLQNTATVEKSRCQTLPMGTMIPKPNAKLAQTLMTWLIGAEWTDARSEQAVAFAAGQWGIPKPEAWMRIDQAVKADSLSELLTKDEFKDYVVAGKR